MKPFVIFSFGQFASRRIVAPHIFNFHQPRIWDIKWVDFGKFSYRKHQHKIREGLS